LPHQFINKIIIYPTKINLKMKKIYLALTCMASLMMMTACGGDKKPNAADTENENTEVVENAEEQSEESEGEEASEEAVANPADA
jgi:cobalamin biosynthesis protein CobT